MRLPVHVRRGDTVEVITGKHRGKRGKVLRVSPKDGRIIVEGVMVAKRHMKPTQKMPSGGIVEKEGGINASNVMVICPSCGKHTRIGHTVLPDGTKVRSCKRCGTNWDK